MKRLTHTPFSDWLRAEGLTVPQVSEALEVTRSTVYGWASGRWSPTAAHLRKLHAFSGGALTIAHFDPASISRPAAPSSTSPECDQSAINFPPKGIPGDDLDATQNR